jgi:hypothetical protein
MIVVYGENNADGYFVYQNNNFPFSGANVSAEGIVSFALTVPDLESIGGGMRYSMPILSEADDDNAYLNGFVKSIYSPIISPLKDAAITFMVSFNPKVLQETRFCFVDFSQEFVATYTEIYGGPLTVAPCEGASLVLEKNAVYLYKNGAKSELYLGLSGTFEVKAGKNLLCGDTATEYITPVQDKFSITFTPNKEAYFIPSDNSKETEQKEYTTCAYLSVDNCDYCCQSQETPFYTPSQTDDVFLYLPLKLTALKDKSAPVFPAIDSELEKILSARRYAVFSQFQGRSNAICYAVTKTGLLAKVENNVLSEIILATYDDNTTTLQKQQVSLSVDIPLRIQLQSARPMVLLDEYPAGLINPKIKSNDWTFDFSDSGGEKWRIHNIRIIMKFAADMSLAEWLSSDNVLQESIKRTRNKDGEIPEHYQEFNEIVNDKNFTGIIILNPTATYHGEGVAKEFIDAAPGVITAHHIIIRAGKIENKGELTLEPSSFNAVIDFKADDAALSYDYEKNPVDYDFATTEIISTVKRNVTTMLKTSSELLINKLFDCSANLTNSLSPSSNVRGNAIVIDGELRTRSGIDTFEYGLRFDGVYAINQSMLNSVTVSEVTLSNGGFTLGGGVGFVIIKDMPDLFGYGGDKPLYFSNLRINRIIDAETKKTDYKIDYTLFTLKQSQPRDGSFAKMFPANAHFLSRETKTPEVLKILTLATPITNSNLSAINSGWWRIDYPLVLGNLGELSSNANFALTVVFCWRGEDFYAGVIPPGGLLGEGLAMSGVLSFTAKAITLAPIIEEDEVIAYNFGFTGIVLKILKFTIPPEGGAELVVRGGADGVAWKLEYRGK